MGAFPGDYEIRASKLIRLWVAEGFLKSNDGDKCLEEEAEDYLKALVDRNLVFIRQHKSNGKAESYSIHDLLRDRCLKKADKEKFLYVKNRQVQNVPEESFHTQLRRVSVHPSYRIRDIYASQEFKSLARSFLCIGLASRVILSPVFLGLRLLRVLDVFDIKFPQFPTEIFGLVNLRYLAFFCHSDFPSAISRLWNLQTLIFGSNLYSICFQSEIWEMPELRHVKCKTSIIWFESNYRINFVNKKLQTISAIEVDGLIASGLLGSIPNIKNLEIHSASSPYVVVDLSHLHRLETLKCSSYLDVRTFLSMVRFPPSLRKLTLSQCTIPWRFMITVSSLINLEVLKVRKCALEGPEIQPEDEQESEATEEEVSEATTEEAEEKEEEEEGSEATTEEEEEKEKQEEWKATEEEFCSLQFLLLENLKLVYWRADESHFPRLRHLVIRGCSELKTIPGGIGETLELIELDECSPSLVRSARKIRKKQSDLGNDLQVRIL